MNRTLLYFKNIKFNSLVNKTISNQGKKKMTIVANKNRIKNHKYLLVRKYTTKTRPLSFNTGPFNHSEPPNDPFWIIIAAAGCGLWFKLIDKK
jgi:hypothetical protein